MKIRLGIIYMNDQNISPYFPSGQRFLKKRDLEYNFDNFINYFGNKIDSNELSIITSGNRDNIQELKSTKVWKWAIIHIFLRIFETITTTLVCALVITIPYYYWVQSGKSIIDINLLYTFIIYALIILFLSIILTIICLVYDKKLGIPLEAIRLT